MRDRVKLVPNLLSAARLALLAPLWMLAIRGEMVAVGCGLVAAGATDVLDGWLARRLDASTPLGAQLDSLADNLVVPSAAAWLVILRPDIVDLLWTPLFVWLCFYCAFLGLGWIKFRRFGNLHLWSAKAAAGLQYAFVVHAFLLPGVPVALFTIAFVLSMASLLEGLAYQAISRRVDEHAGSLLVILRARLRPTARPPRAPAARGAPEPTAQPTRVIEEWVA